MATTTTTRITGKQPATLGNAVSDAIYAAIKSGMSVDVAACVAVHVAVDYYREAYGSVQARSLAKIVLERAE